MTLNRLLYQYVLDIHVCIVFCDLLIGILFLTQKIATRNTCVNIYENTFLRNTIQSDWVTMWRIFMIVMKKLFVGIGQFFSIINYT